ncbi:sigma-70 family RNA polymerase sigma factor [Herbaspirillum sp. alder98]|uniref:sigma-70 family RNA polymerase sigma factor n=1 Tax=Herbaspirillum sp. alder98 TaxID=2913096 RepID=UPI001CD884D5|nr:sigma-70 family RNA polymerase sigma factor [Herbaspirillum sp. alder98]MCA1326155.1 sigma-70 family RNA polymerase sigma factor [Herbaspirillum sp. alder98]
MRDAARLSNEDIAGLYGGHHRWLLGWVRRRTDNAELAADLVQDTFVRVITARRDFYLDQARALLTTIARGLVIDHFRRCALEAAFLDALAQLPQEQAPSPEARQIVLETLNQVDAMLASLPPKVRTAFLLSQLDGMSYADIARQLEVSLSSVQQYMTRAFATCYRVQYGDPA